MSSKTPLPTDAQANYARIPQAPPLYYPSPNVNYGATYQAYSQPGPVPVPVHFIAPQPEPRSSVRRRFLLAFVWAFAIISIIHILARSMSEVRYHHPHRGARPFEPHPWDGARDPSKGWPEPSDGDIDHCLSNVDWSAHVHNHPHDEYPFNGEASFDLPVSSDVLFFLSRGALTHGAIKVVATGHGDDSVKVDVVVHYHNDRALERANVCLLDRAGGHGVGIFTPRRWNHPSHEDQLRFDVTVHLPTTSKDDPLYIKALETHLPIFAHDLGDLKDTVTFGSISLRGSNMPITVGSVFAEQGVLHTSNAPIKGSFNTSYKLDLRTSNSVVDVDVGLKNDDKWDRATDLIIHTSNAPLTAKVNLLAPRSTGGRFTADAHTSNALLDVAFPTSPADAALTLDAKTSNALATVSLHPAYEGDFDLSSSIMSPELVRDREAEDPTGKRRKRTVDMKKIGRGHVSGRVWWGDEPKSVGRVNLKTSVFKAVLKI